MKKSRFTDSQTIAVLKQAETGVPVPELLCREHGISSATFYKWCSKFDGMDASLMSQIRELQTLKTGTTDRFCILLTSFTRTFEK